SELSGSVHGDHWRIGHADRFVFWCRPYLHFADRATVRPGGVWLADPSGGRRATDLRHRRRADYHFSGARAERRRPPVANWQTEIEGVALSLLVSALFSRFQTLREKVRQGMSQKSKLEAAKVFLMGVAPRTMTLSDKRWPARLTRPYLS